MKEKLLTFLNILFILLSIVLVVYNLAFAPQPNWKQVAKILGVLLVWLLSSASALHKQRAFVERVNRDVYR